MTTIIPSHNRTVDEALIRDLLRTVIDPEVGVDIVALGLIYRLDISTTHVLIEITMTSPACPMGDMILNEVEQVLADQLPSILSYEVRLVWSPPWSPAMMSDQAKQHFGWTAQ